VNKTKPSTHLVSVGVEISSPRKPWVGGVNQLVEVTVNSIVQSLQIIVSIASKNTPSLHARRMYEGDGDLRGNMV
jgi:hypothetical protein